MGTILPGDVPHELVTKAEEDIDPSHGCEPSRRSISDHLDRGLINLDKVAGPTSHEVVSWIKRMFAGTTVTKTGHGGTLDPKVTGVLPVALNKATRAVDALLTAGKEYICILKIHDSVPRTRIEDVISMFTGKIFQRPPVRSAVKRTLRVREIYYSQIEEIDGNRVLFRVGCEAGTYIRKLCYDIGEVLGCGGHMDELRRTRSGPLSERDELVTLQDLSDAIYYWLEEGEEDELKRILHPMEIMFEHVSKIIIRDSTVDPICHGANLAVPGVLKVDKSISHKDQVAIFTQKGEVVALGEALMNSNEILDASSGFSVRTTRVFMEPGTYPKWSKN
ncbi:RNA-guided pseudouridylation complex pseudouridine synthase subunit Cbf5 [Candidatus Bathyarchaeota archaeon]|nr:RNA-guided pseudouridylation complex pseudouridine synthase subunit Cbf5 [Candidatus Bathyarchaeota archaeon]